MLSEVYQEGLEITYVTGDTLYSGGWLVKKLTRLGLPWVGVLNPRTTCMTSLSKTCRPDGADAAPSGKLSCAAAHPPDPSYHKTAQKREDRYKPRQLVTVGGAVAHPADRNHIMPLRDQNKTCRFSVTCSTPATCREKCARPQRDSASIDRCCIRLVTKERVCWIGNG